jgi:hypothetical protein
MAGDGFGGMGRSLAFTALLEHQWFAKGSDRDGEAVTHLLEDWNAAGRPDFWEFAKSWGHKKGQLAGFVRKYTPDVLPPDWDDATIIRMTWGMNAGQALSHVREKATT